MNIYHRKISALRLLCRNYHISSDSTKHYTLRTLGPHNSVNSTLLLQNTNLLLENNKLLKELNGRFCDRSVCKNTNCKVNIVYTDEQLSR
uniref:Uncharacterized protein n=1 Tax=viral metagenome TaxID=1070528 RepID=A0A6C0HBN6_9ZZZZ